jgi:hypothetical protein
MSSGRRFLSASSQPVTILRLPVRLRGQTPPHRRVPRSPRRSCGRVYRFRRALGSIFSRGMDRLTKRLEEAGIRADVYEFSLCRLIAFRDDPAPITSPTVRRSSHFVPRPTGPLPAVNVPRRRSVAATLVAAARSSALPPPERASPRGRSSDGTGTSSRAGPRGGPRR